MSKRRPVIGSNEEFKIAGSGIRIVLSWEDDYQVEIVDDAQSDVGAKRLYLSLAEAHALAKVLSSLPST